MREDEPGHNGLKGVGGPDAEAGAVEASGELVATKESTGGADGAQRRQRKRAAAKAHRRPRPAVLAVRSGVGQLFCEMEAAAEAHEDLARHGAAHEDWQTRRAQAVMRGRQRREEELQHARGARALPEPVGERHPDPAEAEEAKAARGEVGA